MIRRTIYLKERIVEITSAGNGQFFVVTTGHVYQYTAEGRLENPWNLESTPAGPLYLGMNGWGIVCQHHLRTNEASNHHSFTFEGPIPFVGLDQEKYSEHPPEASPSSLFIHLPSESKWTLQPYTDELCQRLKETPDHRAVEGQSVIVVKSPLNDFGKIILNASFVSGNVFGALVQSRGRRHTIYRYTGDATERREVGQVSSRKEEGERTYGSILRSNVVAVGWNESNGKGQVTIMEFDRRKKVRGYLCWCITIFIFLCLFSLIFGI